MLRRLHPDQPDSFAFTPDNLKWAEAQMKKFPDGRQVSAIIPLLWRAQEQEGWLSRPAIEYVANMLDLAYIRAFEVASFYFMFQLQPVGSVAHIQVCGTLSCMICGAEDLIGVCQDKIADKPHALSADGKFSWEEVECLGSCANAPMAQIGKDYYEDLTAARLGEIIDELAAGKVPVPGPQNGRFAAEPLKGLTSLRGHESGKTQYNASVQAAVEIGDTVKRIDGTEVPLLTPWIDDGTTKTKPKAKPAKAKEPKPAANKPTDETGVTKQQAKAKSAAKPVSKSHPDPTIEKQPETLSAPRDGGADDLKKISGVGPKLEGVLNELGFWHFDQIAKWTPEEIAWVDSRLKFKGRIARDNWMAQAAELAKKG
ncbi:NADH-quinone oxidoreductase subunit E [Yoonia sp. SDW83-1]|uniref:NADH-quinone oxidoreductase subunit E n=1 Tax=Yoonia sp. SDW83-1 TaxID=3366945 RepID=UPI00398C31C8